MLYFLFQSLPLVNILLSFLGLYLMIIAAKLWKRKARTIILCPKFAWRKDNGFSVFLNIYFWLVYIQNKKIMCHIKNKKQKKRLFWKLFQLWYQTTEMTNWEMNTLSIAPFSNRMPKYLITIYLLTCQSVIALVSKVHDKI